MTNAKQTPPPQDRLYGIAESQQGYFTSKQAVHAGFQVNNHPYYVSAGNWIREARGIYRLKRFPYQDDSELVLWFLWSRNQKGIPQGVYSYETALRIYDLTDLNPARLHLTVPKQFRRRSEIPDGLVLHRQNLEPSDIREMAGFRVTTPLRTLIDIVQAETIEHEHKMQAIDQALEKGWISKAELLSHAVLKAFHEQSRKVSS